MTSIEMQAFINKHGKPVAHPIDGDISLFPDGAMHHAELGWTAEPSPNQAQRLEAQIKYWEAKHGRVWNAIKDGRAAQNADRMRSLIPELEAAKAKLTELQTEYEALPEIIAARKAKTEADALASQRRQFVHAAQEAHDRRLRAEAEAVWESLQPVSTEA